VCSASGNFVRKRYTDFGLNVLVWLEQIAKLNRRIDDYNLKRPIERLELFKLTLESELKRIGARRYL